MTGPDGSAERSVLHIVRGAPDAEELAALTALLAGASARAAPEPAPLTGGWADPAHRLRRSPRSGPGGWAASGAILS